MTRRTILASLAAGMLDSRFVYSSANESDMETNGLVGYNSQLEFLTKALDPNNVGSIETLTTAVLGVPHSFSIPSPIHSIVHPVLTKAEQNHLISPTLGVHENDLSSLLSDMFLKVNAPAFSVVTPHQVRVIRVLTLFTNPLFMGRGITTSWAKVGDAINPYMSPLQSAHLAMVIVDQKLLNHDYQLEPESWEIHHAQLLAKQRKDLSDLYASGGVRQTAAHQSSISENNSGQLLRSSLEKGFSDMSTGNLIGFLRNSMLRIGIGGL